MNKAEQKRYNGIVKLHMKYTTGTSYGVLSDDREQIASDIEGLLKLGRTEKWKTAVREWAHMVRTEKELNWAYYQWATFTGYAI